MTGKVKLSPGEYNGLQPAYAHGNPQDGGDPGLTKREYAAIEIYAQMAGRYKIVNQFDREACSKFAVESADALFAELAK